MNPSARFRLSASELLPLSAKRNLPGALRAAGHLGALTLSGWLLSRHLQSAWAVPLMLVHGYLLAFLFSILHETAHQTAFRTRAINHLLGHFAGFALFLPYEYYRAFHWDHHRHTNDPVRDPELARPFPASTAAMAWYLTGIPTWIDRVRMLLTHGLSGRVVKPWVTPDRQPLIVREARAYLLGYAILVGASIHAGSLVMVWGWVVPLIIGHWFLRPYLLVEHTGCAHASDMLENTRTTHTNALVRWFAWNMPYHTEHHAYPSVPFHALPALHRRLAPHLVNVAPGYLAATAFVMRHLAARRAR